MTTIMTAEPKSRIRKATKPATAKRTRKAKVDLVVVTEIITPILPPWMGADEFAAVSVAEVVEPAEPTTIDPSGTTGTAIVLDHTNFNFSLHDGMITIANPATGSHRTFKIETQADDAKFAPGKRIVSLLTGPDRSNWGDWVAFAFIDDFGVKVWKRYAGMAHETYGRMIENPIKWHAKGCEYMVEVNCRRCGRPLTNPASVASGLGPTCAEKV